MTAFGGLRGTGDWGPDERPKDFRERILWMQPNGTAPFTALLSRVKKEPVSDPEFSWWSEPLNVVRLTVSGALTATDTTITVSSTDPDASDLTRDYGSAYNLVPGDILMVEPAADSATFNPEYIRVTSVISATQFTVERGVAGSTAGTIPDGAALLKVGSAFPEGSSAPDSASRNPIKQFNYTQIFKTTYSVTKTAAQTEARTGDVLKNERKRKAFDHARDMELAFLFGKAYETVDPATGEVIRFTGGLRSFIPPSNTTIFTATPTKDQLLAALEPCFAFDTEAGSTRIAFCGFQALKTIANVLEGTVTLNAAAPLKLWGMQFQTVQLPFGEIAFRVHPIMTRHPLYSQACFVIDFSAITYRPLRGRDTRFEDNIQRKDEDIVRGQWLTEAGIEVGYGGVTCAYIGGLT